MWGLKTGVIPMVFTVLGMLIGWWLAGQYADDVGALVGDWGTFDTAVTVVCYAAIVSLSVFVASKVGSLVKPFIVIGTLGTAGMADKIGGLLIGLIIGLVFTGAFIVALARLSFDLEVSTPDVQIADGAEIMRLAGGKIAAITERRQMMVNKPARIDHSSRIPRHGGPWFRAARSASYRATSRRRWIIYERKSIESVARRRSFGLDYVHGSTRTQLSGFLTGRPPENPDERYDDDTLSSLGAEPELPAPQRVQRASGAGSGRARQGGACDQRTGLHPERQRTVPSAFGHPADIHGEASCDEAASIASGGVLPRRFHLPVLRQEDEAAHPGHTSFRDGAKGRTLGTTSSVRAYPATTVRRGRRRARR